MLGPLPFFKNACSIEEDSQKEHRNPGQQLSPESCAYWSTTLRKSAAAAADVQ